MRKWVWVSAAVALIILLVCGGLWLVEKGITDVLSLEHPLQVLSWQWNTAGEIAITFGGKTIVIAVSEIYSWVMEAWGKLWGKLKSILEMFFFQIALTKTPGGVIFYVGISTQGDRVLKLTRGMRLKNVSPKRKEKTNIKRGSGKLYSYCRAGRFPDSSPLSADWVKLCYYP